MMKITFNKTSLRNILPIIIVALLAGALITGLSWLGISGQPLAAVFWSSILLLVILGLVIRRKHFGMSRLLLVLAVVSGVSLVYLFPELFSPGKR